MVLFYFGILTIVVLISFGGYDATMRLVAYGDLRFRHQIVLLRLWFMKQKLKSQFKKDAAKHRKILKERKNVY
jgi:hypothetical protein